MTVGQGPCKSPNSPRPARPLGPQPQMKHSPSSQSGVSCDVFRGRDFLLSGDNISPGHAASAPGARAWREVLLSLRALKAPHSPRLASFFKASDTQSWGKRASGPYQWGTAKRLPSQLRDLQPAASIAPAPSDHVARMKGLQLRWHLLGDSSWDAQRGPPVFPHCDLLLCSRRRHHTPG